MTFEETEMQNYVIFDGNSYLKLVGKLFQRFVIYVIITFLALNFSVRAIPIDDGNSSVTFSKTLVRLTSVSQWEEMSQSIFRVADSVTLKLPFAHCTFFFAKGSSFQYVRIFLRKTIISYPLIRTRTLLRDISFSENFAQVLNEWSQRHLVQKLNLKTFTLQKNFKHCFLKKGS